MALRKLWNASQTDGNVTLEEFKTAFGYHEIYQPMFHHLDHNADGVLETSDMVKEFLVSDINDDDQIDMKEFETFYHEVLNHIFGNNHCHGHHGGK
ncbi:hypothetical protein CHS0354_037561 [Potamilus streckersoni]|uniref:EF-hand domain-containing protein n=1 Tax=Potamilus streckersoni TaxID=2493646 RepID=A0AAE0SFQ0_9BIVA|nr:hypothetical protein CHS0354_037561 [Potamilus streckersoni]